jgi:hypothetical protein
MTRRGFLGVTGVVGSAVLAGAPDGAARPAPAGLPRPHSAMIAQVARLVAVFPAPFPLLATPAAAAARATGSRVAAVASGLPAGGLALARAGAADLISSGLLGQPQARLAGALSARPRSAAARQRLTAVTALAVASLSSQFGPASEPLAQAWLDGVQGLRRRGQFVRVTRDLEAR